ncbi:MAG TPA: oxalurate catabolism protein HpxZ [Devosia sp.]
MELNRPEVVAEVRAAFEDYERALIANDVAVLDLYFLPRPDTVRFGIAENLFGSEEIAAHRRRGPLAGPDRRITRTVITTFGDSFATVSALFRREGVSGRVGRQMQTWVRMPDGWRVVAAHVSMIDEPA